MRISPVQHDLSILENAGSAALIGVDEAGRGALAGPVVAAATYVPRPFLVEGSGLPEVRKVNDSKRLSAIDRCCVAEQCQEWQSAAGVLHCTGLASVAEIEELNILGATRLAMARALEGLFRAAGVAGAWPAQLLLVDGRPMRGLGHHHTALVGGDGLSFAIGLASILAKVKRDQLMSELDRSYPCYGFAGHKGYGVAAHRKAIIEHGPCEHHRPLFLRKIVDEQRQQELGLKC